MPKTAASDLAARVVGREVRRARGDQGMTQAQLAARLDTCPSYVANLEAGRLNPTIGQLARVANALGVDFDFALRPLEFERLEVVEPALHT